MKKQNKDKWKAGYIVMPVEILNLRDIGLSEKTVLSYINGFGAKGCYMSNDTLGKIFYVSSRTIQRWLQNIRKYLTISNPKGFMRTLRCKMNKDVKLLQKEYATKRDDNTVIQPRQICRTGDDKSGIQPRQICPTIKKEIIKENKAPDSASRFSLTSSEPTALKERKKENIETIAQHTKSFGSGRRAGSGTSAADKDESRRRNLKQCDSMKKGALV